MYNWTEERLFLWRKGLVTGWISMFVIIALFVVMLFVNFGMEVSFGN